VGQRHEGEEAVTNLGPVFRETVEDRLKQLREPFPEETVGKLPATEKRPIELDYVGHAAVTDRLLSVDPLWSWEPLVVDALGMPVYDEYKGLWIKLTICGVTRLGYGDGPDPKQRISDAIRNGAMRFGVALYLWGKDELESLIGNETVAASRKRRPPRSSTPVPRESSSAPPRAGGEPNRMPATDRNRLKAYLSKLSPPVLAEADQVRWVCALDAVQGRGEPLKALSDLTAAEGHAIFSELDI
jgi:hypothetical protein